MFVRKLLYSIMRRQVRWMSTKTNQDYKNRRLTRPKLTKSRMRSHSEIPEMTCKRVILDCDIGTDDAIALYLLLSAELKKLVKIEMIVCTRGNTSLYNVCRNTVRLLEVAQRTDIPVYKGSYDTLLPKCGPEEYYHGVDGFGDLKHDEEPNISIIRPEPALVAMSNLILNNPNQITIIGIGPLTNLALLMRYYRDVKANIKDLFIMGGNHLGIGNITPAAEFNFYIDAEAAQIVFSCAECPLYLLTWEACLETKIPFQWRLDNFGNGGGPTWRLIDRAERAIYSSPNNWMPCDAFLVAAMLYPDIIVKRIQRHLSVELNGQLTRGQVSIDHLNRKPPNSTIIQKINAASFNEIISGVYREF